MLQRIRQNGNDINRYFILDENRQIIVKADLEDKAGDFEIIYDLVNAELLGASSYRVGFSARNKLSDESIEDSFIWRLRTGSAGLLLSFDDDHIASWEQHLDLFDEYGARVTFFLQGEYHPFSTLALSRGHDVGYHSLNHLDLRRVSQEVFIQETLEPLEAFKREGVSFSAFAYPFGFSEPWMQEILLQSYSVLRGYGVTYRLYDEAVVRSGFISSRAIDNIVISGEENFNRLTNSMLRTLKFLENGMILPLTTHEISDSASWGITPRRLEFLLKTAKDLDLVYYRFRDFGNPP
jgi:peptidoglycan/xylan/chitin deacetylase (PgdA/CDA1 family)